MMVYRPAPGGVYFTVKVSLSFLIMSKSISASAGPTTPGAHLIPMLTSPKESEQMEEAELWLTSKFDHYKRLDNSSNRVCSDLVRPHCNPQ